MIWKLDRKTYDEIQKLKLFIEFISEMKIISDEQKIKTEEIKYLLKNIDKPEIYRNWCICLNIFDRGIGDGIGGEEGFYWRNWSVYFESESLEVFAESNHTSYDFGHYGEDFYYYAKVYFSENIQGERIYMDNDFMDFIKDAKEYKKYITKTLNEIEIDISVWEVKRYN